jgi:tetratricopeptide (TPR) repeat protein
MRRRISQLVCLLAIALLPARGAERWLRLSSPHFELLTDLDQRAGAGLLAHLEQVRRFFLAQAAVPEDAARPPVRILAFRTVAGYAPYRLSPTTDAYYVGAPSRDYIVMPLAGPADFHTAAHEYAHLLAHRGGLRLPPWLAEGLSEVLSTIRFRSGEAIVGSPNPARLRALHDRWLPLAEILETGPRAGSRGANGMFYAESWALTHMLLFNPAYSSRFAALLDRCAGGAASAAVLSQIYETALDRVERDLRAWLARSRLPSVTLYPDGPAPARAAEVEPLPATGARLAIAELLLDSGRAAQARDAYIRLQATLPANPDIPAALGRIAILDGRPGEARDHFRRAVELGIRSAPVCYEYAMLAENAGFPKADVTAALERALAIDPGFDDARYSLALAHKNAGRYAAALQHFEALRAVPRHRAFAYYTALADTQLELGLREEAIRSAAEAGRYAQSEDELAHAGELAWMAQSEIAVQLSSEGAGRLRRIPRGADWNPFVEPGDRIQRREGELREVDCSPAGLQLTIFVQNQPLVLSLPNPGRVQVRQGAAGAFEFVCGKQDGARVLVDYAAAPDPAASVAGILRGIRFLP